MDTETMQKCLQAGRIASQTLHYGKSLVKPGMKVVDVLDKVEERILKLGGGIGFPAQMSLNEVAAHACSDLNDATVLQDQVIKLDVGVHIDGCIADNALSVDLSGKYNDLIKASKEALDAAIKQVAPGAKVSEIGKAVEEVISSYSYKPIRNLCGHGIGPYQIHTSPSIPNYDNKSQVRLQEGMVIAIEPFASSGAGMVEGGTKASVFNLITASGARDPITRSVLQEIKTYQGLPFAKRWLERKFTPPKANFALRNLIASRAIYQHPPLADVGGGMVSQHEHSMIVGEKTIVITKGDE